MHFFRRSIYKSTKIGPFNTFVPLVALLVGQNNNNAGNGGGAGTWNGDTAMRFLRQRIL
jgi:hypothetical protein